MGIFGALLAIGLPWLAATLLLSLVWSGRRPGRWLFLAGYGFVVGLVGAALLTVVASFTRSYKEAQTWLGMVLLVPTLPIAVAGVMEVEPSLALMAVPSLSQHFLMQGLLRGEPLPATYALISVGSTLALGAALTWLAGRLYRREKILG